MIKIINVYKDSRVMEMTSSSNLGLGVKTDNDVDLLRFTFDEMIVGTATLLTSLTDDNGDLVAFPLTINQEENSYDLEVTNYVASQTNYTIQVEIVNDNMIWHSKQADIILDECLEVGEGEMPTTIDNWLQNANIVLNSMEEATREANNLNIEVGEEENHQIPVTFTDKEGNQKEIIINEGYNANTTNTYSTSTTDTYSCNYINEVESTQDTKITNLENQVFGDETIEGEGTSLTLNGTLKGQFNEIDLKGNTSQDGTPTPTSPIPVNVVSGDNNLFIVNKNLAVMKNNLVDTTPQNLSFVYNDDGSISYNGTITSNTYTTFTGFIDNSLEAGYYMFSINHSVSYRTVIYVNYEDGTTGSFYISPDNTYTIINIPKKVIRYQFGFTQLTIGTTYNDTLKIQFEKGSTKTDFEIANGNKYNIDLAPQLFDISTITPSNYINSNGALSSSNYTDTSDYIEVQANKEYVITWDYVSLKNSASREIGFYNSSKTFLSRNTGVSMINKIYRFTPTQSGYIRFDYDKNCFDVRLSCPSEGMELCKIPNTNYEDTFIHDKTTDKWYWHKKVGKYVITSFASKGGGNNNSYYTNVINDILKPTSGNIKIDTISNYFESKSANQVYANNISGVGVNTTGTLSCGFTLSSTLTTLELANTWVASNNIVVYYPLATSTDIEVEYQPLIDQLNLLEQAQSKENQTNISQVNNDLPFIISASAFLNNLNGKIALLNKLTEV